VQGWAVSGMGSHSVNCWDKSQILSKILQLVWDDRCQFPATLQGRRSVIYSFNLLLVLRMGSSPHRQIF
jgi:hypothetical protein